MAETSILNGGPLIESIERDLGLAIETSARALNVDRRTVERWRANQSVPQGRTRERLRELVALRDRRLRMFGAPERAQEWLRSPACTFAGSP